MGLIFEIQVVGDVEIQVTVIVKIEESRTLAPERIIDSRLPGDVGEGPVAEIAIQDVGTIMSDKEIGPTVVVDVSHRYARPVPPIPSHATVTRDIRESSIPKIAVEGVSRCPSPFTGRVSPPR